MTFLGKLWKVEFGGYNSPYVTEIIMYIVQVEHTHTQRERPEDFVRLCGKNREKLVAIILLKINYCLLALSPDDEEGLS